MRTGRRILSTESKYHKTYNVWDRHMFSTWATERWRKVRVTLDLQGKVQPVENAALINCGLFRNIKTNFHIQKATLSCCVFKGPPLSLSWLLFGSIFGYVAGHLISAHSWLTHVMLIYFLGNVEIIFIFCQLSTVAQVIQIENKRLVYYAWVTKWLQCRWPGGDRSRGISNHSSRGIFQF